MATKAGVGMSYHPYQREGLVGVRESVGGDVFADSLADDL